MLDDEKLSSIWYGVVVNEIRAGDLTILVNCQKQDTDRSYFMAESANVNKFIVLRFSFCQHTLSFNSDFS